jgi:hypothetical protein
MRASIIGGFLLAAIMAFGPAGTGQEPPPPPGDRPPRGFQPADDAPPPPPAKGKRGERALFETVPPEDSPPPAKGKRGEGRPGGGPGDFGGPKGQYPPGGRIPPGTRFPPGIPVGESPFEEQIRTQSEATLFMHDRNRDGKLDRDEWSHMKDPEAIDTNKDGVITLAELINGPHTTGPFNPAGPARGGGGGFGGGGARAGGPGMVPPGFGGFGGYGGPPQPDDPEMRDLVQQDVELDRQAGRLASQIHSASGEERMKLKPQLAQLVSKHFDVRQERRKLQLKRMEEELKRLRDEIGKRNDSRESIVGNRVSELIGEPRDLDF